MKQVRQFLRLASYYRRFVPKFASVASPLHALTKKDEKFQWSEKCNTAFETLKQKLIETPVLAYPQFDVKFIVETDASVLGLGAILSQYHSDEKLHPVAFTSRALSPSEKNYSITELETLAVVWAMSHFHAYVYGNEVLVYTDHSAILETPSPNGKHARWWTKVYGSGVKQLEICYRPGKENANADALSRNPEPATTNENFELDAQVLAISSRTTEQTVQELLNLQPSSLNSYNYNFGISQREDPEVKEIIDFLLDNKLPEEEKRKQKVATQAPLFTIVDDILYYVNPKQNNEKRVVVPKHLRDEIMKENHSGRMAGHF